MHRRGVLRWGSGLAGDGHGWLRDAAWALQSGGVGFYPQSQLVHVDVGRVRRWQGA